MQTRGGEDVRKTAMAPVVSLHCCAGQVRFTVSNDSRRSLCDSSSMQGGMLLSNSQYDEMQSQHMNCKLSRSQSRLPVTAGPGRKVRDALKSVLMHHSIHSVVFSWALGQLRAACSNHRFTIATN